MPPVILCHTLGPVEVTVDGRPPPPELLWRKHLALLLYLAASPRRTRTRSHLIGLLWQDRTESAARHSLNEAMRVIRRAAGDAALASEGEQVRLAPEAVRLDTETLAAMSAAGDWQGAAELIAGDFLEGFSVPGASGLEDWLAVERRTWRERSVLALARRATELLEAGQADPAADLADRALRLDPLSDTAMRAVLRAMAIAGRGGGALARYEEFERRLRDTLGTEPDAATLAVADRLRADRSRRSRPAATPPAGAGARRPPLVGREGELRQALSAWSRCRDGRRAAVLLVEADQGMGKTLLLETLRAHAVLDGASVSGARAVEADASAGWSALVGLACGGLLEFPALAAAAPWALGAFTGRIPAWAERFPDVRDQNRLPGEALAEILRVTAEEAPVVLAVDDAHWLDGESLRGLEAVVRDRNSAPLLLALATTAEPAPAALDQLRSRIGRDVEGTVIRLPPLGPAPLRALARWWLPGFGDAEIERVSRRVATDSAGVPLLASELFRAVAEGMDLDAGRSAWPAEFHTLDQSLPSDLPDTIVAAIRVGVRRLSPAAQQVLVAASVLEPRVPPDTLAAASGLDLAAMESALDELEWHRWLASEPRGYAFVARIVREVVARDMLTAGQRARIRERAGRVRPGSGPGAQNTLS